MRNALGLMLASFVAALVIAGHLVLDLLATAGTGRAEHRQRPAGRAACRVGARQQISPREDVEVTAAIPAQPPVAMAAAQ